MRTNYFLMTILSFILAFFSCSDETDEINEADTDELLLPTPPMGWNSWNKFGGSVNEEIIREMADAMVTSGMKDAGYEYIILDDCWQGGRDESYYYCRS